MQKKIIWRDHSRILSSFKGFEDYCLTEECLTIEKGLLTRKRQAIMLYQIEDVHFQQTAVQRFFGVGDVIVKSKKPMNSSVKLKQIEDPNSVMDLLINAIEEARERKGIVISEHAIG